MASSVPKSWQKKLENTGGMIKFLQGDRFADIDISCGEHSFKAHKLVLSAQSEFFSRLIDSSFREGQSSCVSLKYDDPALITRMLLFIYASTYPTTPISEVDVSQFKTVQDQHLVTDDQALQWIARSRLHVHMYALADKYDIPTLKMQSKERFLISFYEKDEDSVDCSITLGAPDRSEDWTANAEIIDLVYTATPCTDRELRSIVLAYCIQMLREASEYRAVLASAAVRKLVLENAESAIDLALHTASTVSYKCDLCPGISLGGLSWRCECGEIDYCTEEACVLKAKEESFCTTCKRLACLTRVQDNNDDSI